MTREVQEVVIQGVQEQIQNRQEGDPNWGEGKQKRKKRGEKKRRGM